MSEPAAATVPLRTIALQWTRIGVTGFGGPPTHIALLRRLVVEQHRWVDQREFEDALAACNLLPGPASTQLAMFLARRTGGPRGAVVGGLGFILPSVILITALSAVFFGETPPASVLGAGAAAGAAVAAVAVRAGTDLARRSLARAASRGGWLVYVALGVAASAVLGAYVVLVLLACGVAELFRERLVGRGVQGWAPIVAPALRRAAWVGLALSPGWRSRSERCPMGAGS